MAEVTGLTFSLADVLEHVSDPLLHMCGGNLSGLGFHVAIPPEFVTAAFAAYDAVIGHGVIGGCEGDGVRAADLATERDVDFVGHSLLPVDQGELSQERDDSRTGTKKNEGPADR